jgi:hypothetical protein
MKRHVFCCLLGLFLVLIGGSVAVAQGPGELVVDASEDLGPINPLVYGTNHGPWAAVPVELLPAAETAGITWIRFPGGNWGDLNDIAPWQLDAFIGLCNLMGAEPSVHVRLENGMPEQAAELVRYANIEKGYGVRYWAIGNEPNLFDDYDTEQFNRDWRAIAEAMLAVDPSIILLGPELSQYPPDFAATPKDREGRDWMAEFLQANGDMVDIVTIHRYPFPVQVNTPTTIDEMRVNSAEWDTIIPNLRALIREVTGRDLPVGVTEVNSHWSSSYGGPASPDSFYNAIWLGDVLGRLIMQKVEMVAHFTLQSPNSYGGWGLFGKFEDIRPSYYVYQMYQRFGTELLGATNNDDPDVTIYAARREDGALTLIVVNLADEAQTRSLTLNGFEPGGPAEVWLFDAEHNAEQVDALEIASGMALTVPAQSVSLYIVPAGGAG